MSYKLLKVEQVGGLSEKHLKEMEALEAVPGERPLRHKRLDFIENLLCDGEFNRCEWARCRCKEDKKHYRVNGQHTTHQLRAVLDGDIEAEFPAGVPVMMSRWECDTLVDLADVFNQFDNHISTRSSDDKLGIYMAQHKDMIGIDKELVKSILAGVAWAYTNVPAVKELFPGEGKLMAYERGQLLNVDKVRSFIDMMHEYADAPFSEWIKRTGIIARIFDLYVTDEETALLTAQQLLFEVGDDAKKFTHLVRQQKVRTGKDQGWYYRKADQCVRELIKSQTVMGRDELKELIREVMEETALQDDENESIAA